jgi:UDP-glucose 4-epimerase
MGNPKKIVVFSRDEAKQHEMRLGYQCRRTATDDVIYNNFRELLQFQIGDVRNRHSISSALGDADVVFNAAALKQVPTCEYFPFEALLTNAHGAQNIVSTIRELKLPIDTVVGVSTDKACKPINVMGMTKAIQERIFVRANLDCPDTRFFCVRYGNVLASRGSVIPLFHEQIRQGVAVTITTPEMTRFLLSLNQAVDTVFDAFRWANRGEIYIPRIPSARIVDIAETLVGGRPNGISTIGIRPGEKLHEVLVSEEESYRAVERGNYYVILPILPELRNGESPQNYLAREYNSTEDVMNKSQVAGLLKRHRLMVEDKPTFEDDQ